MSKRKPTPPIAAEGWRSVEEHDNPRPSRPRSRASSPTAPASSTAPRVASSCSSSAARWRSPASPHARRLQGSARRRSCPTTSSRPTSSPARRCTTRRRCQHGGSPRRILATAWEGRPTKIEGNPEHPTTKGVDLVVRSGGDPLAVRRHPRPRAQAARRRAAAGCSSASTIGAHLEALKADGGAKLAFLVEPSCVAAARPRCRSASPPPSRRRAGTRTTCSAIDEAYEGARIAFGRPLETQLDLTKAKVVVSLDADFLGGWPMYLSAQRQWAERRAPGAEMSRLYVAEAMLSCTGMMADHRLRTRSVGHRTRRPRAPRRGQRAAAPMPATPRRTPGSRRWPRISRRRGGDAVVVVGPRQPAAVHALVHAINAALKSTAVRYTAPLLPTLRAALGARRRAQGGPRRHAVHHARGTRSTRRRASSASPQLLAKVPNAIYLAHARGRDRAARGLDRPARARARELGRCAAPPTARVTLQQPLITPLFNGISHGRAVVGVPRRRRHGRLQPPARGLPDARRGRLPAHAAQGPRRRQRADRRRSTALQSGAVTGAADKLTAAAARDSRSTSSPDRKVLDGRFANNVWLQELPDAVTKLTWDNALILSPRWGAPSSSRPTTAPR